MPLKLPPDGEKIVADFLRAQSDVVDLDLDGIFTDLQGAHPAPSRFVLVDQLSGPKEYPRWLAQLRLQIGAWHKGGTKPSAKAVIHTVQAVLPLLEGTSHTEGFVGAVDVASSATWQPDAVATPATPRWLLDVTLVAHPL